MLFPYLLKVSFLLMILTLCYRWLIQYETFSKINRILLFLNIAATWSLPLIPIAGWWPEKVQEAFKQTTVSAVAEVIPVIPSSGTITWSPMVQEESYAIGFMEILMLVYFIGIFVFALRFLFQLGSIISMIRKYPSEAYIENLKIVRNPETTSPYTFFNWIICNQEKHTDKEFEHILSHEAEHALQWHSMDLLLAELQRIILWFNPFAWFHQRLVAENLEYLADQAVLKHGFNKRQYQFSLLNAALQTKELPLTNSFAQSMLKKRIKMMNKKPSKGWTLGKYGLLILLIYGSSAFVAPYREHIVEMSPVPARQIVSALLPKSPSTGQQVSRDESEPETPTAKSSPTLDIPLSEPKAVSIESAKLKTKGILIRNDTLYWAISALTTWDDINGMRKEIKDFGAEFNITSFKYDPLNLFLTSLSVQTKEGRDQGQGSTSDFEKEEDFKPIRIYSGYVVEGGFGMGQLPPAPLLASVEADYQRALSLLKSNEVAILEHKIIERIGRSGITGYSKKTLEGKNADGIFLEQGFGRSVQNTLKVGEQLKNATFYINGKSVSIDAVTSMDFEKLISVQIAESQKGDNFVLIRVK